MVMPDLGGAELARELARAHPECAVVFMSAQAVGPPEPGFAFLQKPFTHESLAHTVRRVLDEAREAAA
jgi:FixJ family two-component response regulator